MLSVLRKITNKLCRPRLNRQLQSRLQNHEMSVISSNCNGALILHDLGEQFRSPFVNLYLEPSDFIKFLQNPQDYLAQSLTFEPNALGYPLGKLGDLHIHFMHYHSEQEALEKWQARSQRINWDNLFIIFTDRDGCTYQNLQDFDRLPYPNKVVFTHKPYPEFRSAFHIKGFEKQTQVGDLFDFSGWFGKKYYDQFDYVEWFNTARGNR